MEKRDQVKVKSGKQFDHLFPRAMLTSIVKKEGATVADTIRFIPQVVRDTLFHTQKISKVLKRENVYETCRAIWQFVYDHIAYKKDEDGKEQVRSPARAWHDRGNIQGVDCDCYTTFISSILSNLKIRHILRITKYSEDHFQHIYPIVPLNNGTYITIDCVVRHFDYEEPYSEKKDTKMDLEYLNGVNDTSNNIDAQDLLGANPHLMERDELGKLKDLFKKGTNPFQSDGSKKGKLKDLLHKAMNFTNKANPGTAILRAGVLAAMKLNVFKIAQRLKYGYLTDEEAQSKGVDMTKFQKLRKVREKIEKIFYDAGGSIDNLKNAILTGRGNKGKRKDMNGLGRISTTDSLSKILGSEIYQSEIMDGLGSLGEPYSATASITAATGILGAIAGLLKAIGSLFPKKTKGAEDFENTDNATSNTEASDSASDMSEAGSESTFSEENNTEENSSEEIKPEVRKAKPPLKRNESGSSFNTTSKSVEENKSSDSEDTSNDSGDAKPPGFWARNKKWLLPTSIGAGVLALSYAAYRMIKKNKEEKPKQKAQQAVSGIPKSNKKKKGGKNAGIKSKKHKKQAVALL